jgi:hypothetical protein
MILLYLAHQQTHPRPLFHHMVILLVMLLLHMSRLCHPPILILTLHMCLNLHPRLILRPLYVTAPSLSDPPPLPPHPPTHVSAPSTSDPPLPPPPPPPPLVSPSIDLYPSSPHVSSYIDPPPLHVSQDFDALDTMLTLGTIAYVDDLDRESFDSALMSTFIFDIIIDRPSTSSSRDTDASGFGGGPS